MVAKAFSASDRWQLEVSQVFPANSTFLTAANDSDEAAEAASWPGPPAGGMNPEPRYYNEFIS